MLTRIASLCRVLGRVNKGNAGLGGADGHGAVCGATQLAKDSFTWSVVVYSSVRHVSLLTIYLRQGQDRTPGQLCLPGLYLWRAYPCGLSRACLQRLRPTRPPTSRYREIYRSQ